MKRIGIFGGSFNPIHIGHLALGNYLCEAQWVDELWYVVSPQNPFKIHQDLLEDSIRLEMVQKATEDYPRFKACDIEFGLPRPSYMVHTLDELKKNFPDYEFVLIIGADNWVSFPRWYQADRIMQEHEILVYPRPGSELSAETMPPHVHVVQTPLLEISSTFIREGIQKGWDLRYFLPESVYSIIKDKKLYRQ